MPADADPIPTLSIVMPTFNNEKVLRRAVDGWRRFGGDDIELIVVNDGSADGTADYLAETCATEWGARHLRVVRENDAHELRCTNHGFETARGTLLAAWQDDMFLQVPWLVPELIATFARYSDLGLFSLSRGLFCVPFDAPIDRWEDAFDWRRIESTIGVSPGNWVRLQEVDAVIRPWVVRRACLDKVGMLDEAFRPTEWDEADLAFRIRAAGWRVATHGYERDGAYSHLGSTTIGNPSEAYRQRVVNNARLFYSRWEDTIRRDHPRARRTWRRQTPLAGWIGTAWHFVRAAATRPRRSA